MGYTCSVATSRQRFLDYIRSHQAVTVLELSQALHSTRANAHHHLAILQGQGLVEVIGLRPAEGKGRPQHVYGLARQVLGDNLDKLASALLSEIASSSEIPLLQTGEPGYASPTLLEGKALEEMLFRIARRIISASTGSSSPPPAKIASLTQRLYQAVRRLNDLHYQARWEARGDAPRLIFAHCPYAAIISKHPELCRMDSYLLQELLGASAAQTARLAKDGRGATYCAFRIT